MRISRDSRLFLRFAAALAAIALLVTVFVVLGATPAEAAMLG